MLLAQNLSCLRSGRLVLDALDFHVAPREIVALVGPADAGKTTALECFLGLHAPAAGRACVADVHAALAPNAAAALVAHVPAQLSFPKDARIFPHTRNTCILHGRRIPDAVLRAALVRGGIDEGWHERRIVECSPAVHRKLGLVLAVLKNTRALLLDEPTRDLDATEVNVLVADLRRLRKADAAILLATRDLAFATRLATRVVLLERGAIVETLDPNAPRRSSDANAYLAKLVA